jgi:hypothetical protein
LARRSIVSARPVRAAGHTRAASLVESGRSREKRRRSAHSQLPQLPLRQPRSSRGGLSAGARRAAAAGGTDCQGSILRAPAGEPSPPSPGVPLLLPLPH